MDRPNWKFVLPAAAAGGFVLVGFWGLLAGPLGTAWFLSWRRKRDAAEGADDDTVLELRLERHPRMIGRMLRAEGLPINPSHSQLVAYAEKMAIVKITPLEGK